MSDLGNNLGDHIVCLGNIFINSLKDTAGDRNFLGIFLDMGNAFLCLLYHIGNL